MIRAAALRESITIYAVTDGETLDRYGNAVPSESDGVTVRAAVKPISEMEKETSGDLRISMYRVLVEPGTAVNARSRVDWQSRTFEVLGEPQLYTANRGVHHIEFDIREIQGG